MMNQRMHGLIAVFPNDAYGYGSQRRKLIKFMQTSPKVNHDSDRNIQYQVQLGAMALQKPNMMYQIVHTMVHLNSWNSRLNRQ